MQRVLLTGANGFLASHILDQLLTAGIQVQAVVRSEVKANQVLKDFTAYHDGSRLSIATVADYAAPGAFDSIVASNPPFDAVIHTISGFGDRVGPGSSPTDHPAVKATLELLGAIQNHAPHIKRVVITSTNAAAINPSKPSTDPTSRKIYDEEDWYPVTWEEALVGGGSIQYKASKKFMEITARDFVEKQHPNFDLTILCPAAIFGPMKHVVSTIDEIGESNKVFWKIFCNGGKESPLPPKQAAFSYVDVRDVANAHILAAKVPAAGNRRLIIGGVPFTYQQFCDIIHTNIPALSERTPSGNPGDYKTDPSGYDLSNAQAVKVLDLKYRPMEETVVDLAKQLLEVEKGQV